MKYFSINELSNSVTAKRLRLNNTPNKNQIECLTKLIDNILDPLREKYGKPIIVDSGYRSTALNRAVRGSSTSQHLLGQAADIHSVSDTIEDNKELFDLIKIMKLPYDQLINEYNYNWIHVSYGPKNRRQVITIV